MVLKPKYLNRLVYSMARVANPGLVAVILVLLIVVLAAVQGGAAPGPGGWWFKGQQKTTTQSGHTTYHYTTGIRRTTTFQTQSGGTATGPNSGGNPQGPGGTIGFAGLSMDTIGWAVLIPMVILLGVGMVMALLRLQKPRVFDLKDAIKELESQKRYFVGSWSMKMRNAALLRYYLLMAEICSKVGIEDHPTDTPHQFIGRAATELDVGSTEAERFAGVVDRAHYGMELSADEVADASTFMDSFTKVVRGKVNLG